MANVSKFAPLTRDDAYEQLRNYAAGINDDPRVNSVFRLAQSYYFALSQKQISISDLAELANAIGEELFFQRCNRLNEKLDAKNSKDFARTQHALNSLDEGNFSVFKTRIERIANGIVFTAHPTFVSTRDVRKFMSVATSGQAKDVPSDLDVFAHSPVSLQDEHNEAQHAIAQAKTARRKYVRVVLDAAEAVYPKEWRQLRPAAPTIASWVGYDLDGRDDIKWWTTLAFRLREKAEQLAYYGEELSKIAKLTDSTALRTQADKLKAASELTFEQADNFDADLSQPENIVTAANELTKDHPNRITDLTEVCEAIESHIEKLPSEPAKSLIVLVTEMQQTGLGTARIHLRINSTQIQTVIRRDLGVLTEDRELGRVALETLSDRIQSSDKVDINFADLFIEQSTARRQFMLCAQILKHIDARTPIRFLIAESENPATVLGALYLARQYDVDHLLDISPLLETPEALENGGRFIARLLEVDEFSEYVKSRGQLSIQLGFSDAGRFIGQVAADMAIERIHNLIANALADKLKNVSLLLFNTHGESVGRGGHPGSFQHRLQHLLSDWTRRRCADQGIGLIHETSFQGGDGYLHFSNEDLANSAMDQIASRDLQLDETEADSFYTETSLVWDFYRALRSWQETLFDNEDYGRLLSDFAGGFRLKAGSRPQRRASGPSGPRSLRAISHNATLQQLGILANTACGIGSALVRESDDLADVINGSKRLRSLIDLAVHARMLTSIPALRAYANIYDPDYWVAVSKRATGELAQARVRIAEVLTKRPTERSIASCANTFSIDLGRFDSLIAKLDDAPSIEHRHEARLPIHVLHAIRQSAMLWAFEIAGRLPAFSSRHGFQIEAILDLIFEMKIGAAARLLKRVYPVSEQDVATLDQLTEPRAGDSRSKGTDYQRLNEAFITPLTEIDALIKRVTLAIAHAHGAYG